MSVTIPLLFPPLNAVAPGGQLDGVAGLSGAEHGDRLDGVACTVAADAAPGAKQRSKTSIARQATWGETLAASAHRAGAVGARNSAPE